MAGQSKHYDKEDLIMRMFKEISGLVQAAIKADPSAPPGVAPAVEAGIILGEVVLQDIHRCANALERCADALETMSQTQGAIYDLSAAQFQRGG